MTDEQIGEEINKMIVSCKGDIPSLIQSVEATGKKFPNQEIIIKGIVAGLKRSIGKVT